MKKTGKMFVLAWSLAGLFTGAFAAEAQARLVEYAFDIDAITVDYSGRPVQALAVGGQIPAPTIEATVGDTLRVTFHNKLDEDSSVHWHGVLLPHDQDGVPWLNTQPIGPGSSFTYEYKVRHAGTYWYHSHSGLQEQRGIYGALVFHPRHPTLAAERDYVVVFSDWTDENPEQVLRNLKKDGDYYARQKDSVQSWDEALAQGREAVDNRLRGAWMRMGSMDLSDVGYNLFLSNGQREPTLAAEAGERARLRLINASASSYLNVEFAGGPMTLIAADGVDVAPQKVKRLRMAVAETYDVIVDIPERRAYALRATSEDGTGHSDAFIGAGERVLAPDLPRPNLYLMSHAGHGSHGAGGYGDESSELHHHQMDHAGHAAHGVGGSGDEIIEHLTDYAPLRAKTSTALPEGAPVREVRLKLTGNMERYIWSFNNQPLSQANSLLIRKGENVRFILDNETMMNHPLHLHGHFFRVLNGQGDYSPLKHTVNVAALSRTVIEFQANEEKDWFFHCHNLYHMRTGMARVVSYEDSSLIDRATIKKIAHDDDWYFRGETQALSQMTAGDWAAANVNNVFELEYDFDYGKDYKAEVFYKRYAGRFLNFQAGAHLKREEGEADNVAAIGLGYTLPLLIDADLRLDSNRDLRLRLHSEMQLTQRVKLNWKWELATGDKDEYRVGLAWEVNKTLSLITVHDSDFHTGVGAQFMF